MLLQTSISLANTSPKNEVDHKTRQAYLMFYDYYTKKLEKEKEIVKVRLYFKHILITRIFLYTK